MYQQNKLYVFDEDLYVLNKFYQHHVREEGGVIVHPPPPPPSPCPPLAKSELLMYLNKTPADIS